MTDVTNAERSARAQPALQAYIDQTGTDDFEGYAISDLIADLGHLCDQRGFDFLATIERGVGHWLTEKHPETHDPVGFLPAVRVIADGGGQ